MNSSSSSSHTVMVPSAQPPASAGIAIAGPSSTVPGSSLSKVALMGYPEEDKKQEWEPEFRETFSKGILKMRLQEFNGGKYTKKYIDVYLEFMHLSGMIGNLDYLEFKNQLLGE